MSTNTKVQLSRLLGKHIAEHGIAATTAMLSELLLAYNANNNDKIQIIENSIGKVIIEHYVKCASPQPMVQH